MSKTFDELVALCKVEIDNKNVKVDPFLREAIPRQLEELSHNHTVFMEAKVPVTLVPGTYEYTGGVSDFPLDVQDINGLFLPGDSYSYEVVEKGIVELETMSWPTATSQYPDFFAWHNETMFIWPVPDSAQVLRLYYLRDATRDENTGEKIDSLSTTQTNRWFGRGLNILRCSVLLEYHMSISKDSMAAQLYAAQVGAFLASTKADFMQRRQSNRRVQFVF